MFNKRKEIYNTIIQNLHVDNNYAILLAEACSNILSVTELENIKQEFDVLIVSRNIRRDKWLNIQASLSILEATNF